MALPSCFICVDEVEQGVASARVLGGLQEGCPAGGDGRGDCLGVLPFLLLLKADGFLELIFPPAAFGFYTLVRYGLASRE